jgi:hypothetical protein
MPATHMPRALLAAIAAPALLWPRLVMAQEPTLATVLERAGAYVLHFQRELAGIVAEERYVQNVPETATVFGSRERAPVRHRELVSDLLLVRPVVKP